jgi:lysophospholipase L1-like esterase
MVGDSIGFGQGASDPDDTLGRRLAGRLAGAGIPTELHVFAVPGTRSEGLRPQVERALSWGTDLAVLVIGANDLTHFVPVTRAVEAFGDALHRLRASGAQVVVAPAPDLSSVPHVPPALRPQVQRASERLRDQQVAVALEAGARIADRDGATAKAFAADHSLFCPDLFHPSSAGYGVIADALYPEVVAAARAFLSEPKEQQA